METVLRSLVMYLLLMLLLRVAGKRTLASVTTFDLILLLVISEATQQALLGDDFSVATAALVIVTLIGVDRTADYLGFRFPFFSKLIDGTPTVVVDNGRLLEKRMERLHIDRNDILQAARQNHGLERMDQIKYAVLEKSGGISVVPR